MIGSRSLKARLLGTPALAALLCAAAPAFAQDAAAQRTADAGSAETPIPQSASPSPDEGDTWKLIARHLPAILSVEVG